MAIRGRPGAEEPEGEGTPVFRLRDMPMEPYCGSQGPVKWRQYRETVQLRLPLEGEGWKHAKATDFDVQLKHGVLLVGCRARGEDQLLEAINGKLKREVMPEHCWYDVERDLQDPRGAPRILMIELRKAQPARAWSDDYIFCRDMFRRKAFPWSGEDDKEEGSGVALRRGRPSDVEDPYVVSRSWLCTELEQGQTEDTVQFRIVLDQKKLDEALEKVPYYRLFGIECSVKRFKLFIRGDESSPILLGDFYGKARPHKTDMRLSSVTREVEGHRIKGTTETLPCLDVFILKAAESLGEWEEPLSAGEEVLNTPQGSLEEFERQQLRLQREPSPDREDWTPDDWADEQKDKGDVSFKNGEFRDAVVYYTRALRWTPTNERILSNRSMAYLKISRYQLALDDAKKAEEINPSWSKIYFRKGQALRGLRKYDDAISEFLKGKDEDPGNAEWDREVQRTQEVKAARAKAAAGQK